MMGRWSSGVGGSCPNARGGARGSGPHGGAQPLAVPMLGVRPSIVPSGGVREGWIGEPGLGALMRGEVGSVRGGLGFWMTVPADCAVAPVVG